VRRARLADALKELSADNKLKIGLGRDWNLEKKHIMPQTITRTCARIMRKGRRRARGEIMGEKWDTRCWKLEGLRTWRTCISVHKFSSFLAFFFGMAFSTTSTCGGRGGGHPRGRGSRLQCSEE